MKKEDNKREDQADTRLEGVRISRKAPLASFKAFNAAENPVYRFSCSRLSAASSSENRADDGSSVAIHWSGGSPLMGERLPPNNRAKGGSLWVLPTTVMMTEDPSAMSSSIRHAPGTTAWTAGGVDCATPSDATMAVSDPAGLVAARATSVWASGGANCAALSDTTAVASNSVRPTSGAVT